MADLFARGSGGGCEAGLVQESKGGGAEQSRARTDARRDARRALGSLDSIFEDFGGRASDSVTSERNMCEAERTGGQTARSRLGR